MKVKRRFTAPRTRRVPGKMNGLETKFLARLEDQTMPFPCPKEEDEWALYEHPKWCGFERLQLKLADRTTYTPDFAVLTDTGRMVIFEVKGFWRDDARVKLKVAAEQYFFFDFYSVSWSKAGGWVYERFGA